ncbi:MAG: hypothetical protein ACSW8A_04430 [Lachnospiraceae bacterium]
MTRPEDWAYRLAGWQRSAGVCAETRPEDWVCRLAQTGGAGRGGAGTEQESRKVRD